MSRRILLTGGAGFIGSNLVHYLLQKAEQETGEKIELIVNLDKLTYAGNLQSLRDIANDPRHQFVRGDITEAGLISHLLEVNEINCVMHLAAESHVDRSIDSPGDFIQTNFVGTFRMLDCAKHYAANVPGFRFLHVSTDEVYGSLKLEDPAFSETTPYAPNSPYSASKAGSDHLARAYHHTFGMDIVTTNCSNNYGPYQFPEKLIPLMIQKAMRGEKLPVYGDGTNVRDWLYVEDHCRGLFAALTKGRAGEVYNIGGKCEMQNIQVVKRIIQAVNEAGFAESTETLISFVKDRPGHDWRYAIDCSKIESELGWKPQETFESGLARTVKWYLDQREWVEAVLSGSYRGERLGVA